MAVGTAVNMLGVKDLRFVRGDYCLLGCEVLWSGRNLTAEDSTAAV